jgi:hypothetical protein
VGAPGDNREDAVGCDEGACEGVLDGEVVRSSDGDSDNFAEGTCEVLKDGGEEGASVRVETGEPGKAEG